jgi:hypothetical protein
MTAEANRSAKKASKTLRERLGKEESDCASVLTKDGWKLIVWDLDNNELDIPDEWEGFPVEYRTSFDGDIIE